MDRIKVIHDNITKIKSDIIVNAANTSLLGGGGVDGAIHKAGGKEILNECIKIRNKQGGCQIGEAVITTAGNLRAEKIIHTVGPVWNDGKNNEIELLKKCYNNIIELTAKYHFKTVAIPNISTGTYKFPKELAAQIAIEEIKKKLMEYQNIEVTFVCFDNENYEIYKKYLNDNKF